MSVDTKGRELFIVDNSVSGWTGLRYLEEWSGIAQAFDIATGYFEVGALLALDGKWQGLDKIRILMGDEHTHRTRKAILAIYVNPRLREAEVLEQLELRENSMWTIGDARRSLASALSDDRFIDVLYRPFDIRRTFFHKSVVFNMRLPVMKHMVSGRNLALICSRMTKGESFAHVFVSQTISEAILLSSKTSNNAFSFPKRLGIDSGEDGLFCRGPISFRSNISQKYIDMLRTELTGKSQSVVMDELADQTFYFVYSLLHSPSYRQRYMKELSVDFPRVPIPLQGEMFRHLAEIGQNLVSLHLLEASKVERFITEYIGGRAPEVEKISWSRNTVWVDRAETTGFKGVREEVWNFHIGGYQVCEKWLKDRKGRKLLADDIRSYQKIVVALSETIRLMKKIDETIEEHGGWPGAFVAAN